MSRFFMTGYLGIGFEYAAELTYPIQEGTSSGLLNMSSELFGIIFTLAGGEMFELYDDRVTNIALIIVLLAGFVMTIFIQGELKRRILSKEMKEKNCVKQESQMA
jgi:MFS transporter, FLVCR family, feline leukemia virus subgroup C receptor-related protein